VSDLTPEQEALYALGWDRPRSGLSPAAQVEYDRLKLAWEQDAAQRTAAGLARRHRVDPSGATHTFRYRRGFHLVLGIVVAVFGVVLLVGQAAALAYPHSSWAQGNSTGDYIWFAAAGLLLVWVGIRLLRVGVQISSGKMTIRGYFATRTVNASEIRAITVQPRDEQGGPRWKPRVELSSGKSLWIGSFDCGSAREPLNPELAATVQELRVLLGVGADDTTMPESHRPSGAGAE
jgi:hypothetical protein